MAVKNDGTLVMKYGEQKVEVKFVKQIDLLRLIQYWPQKAVLDESLQNNCVIFQLEIQMYIKQPSVTKSKILNFHKPHIQKSAE